MTGVVQSAGTGTTRLIIFRARGLLCGLPLGSITELMRPLPVEPFPKMPPFVLGISVVRGYAVPVVDAGAMLHGGESESPSRFLSLRAGNRRAVLAVERVLGIRDLGRQAVTELPPLLGVARAEVVDAVGTLDRELLLVLGAGRLISQDVWSVVEKREGGA